MLYFARALMAIRCMVYGLGNLDLLWLEKGSTTKLEDWSTYDSIWSSRNSGNEATWDTYITKYSSSLLTVYGKSLEGENFEIRT